VRGKTVLFIGAGRHQRRAIRRAKQLGLRVAAIDRNPEAAGFVEADVTEVVDFADVSAAVAAARRQPVMARRRSRNSADRASRFSPR